MADIDTAPAPTFKKRTNKSSNIRKRPATPPPAQDSASDSDYSTDDDESGARIKRRKKEGLTASISTLQSRSDLSKSTRYSADRSTAITTNDDATKTSHWTDSTADAAVSARAATLAKSEAQSEAPDGSYKGASSYGSFIQKHPDAAERKVGPVKAPTNVRMVVTTDFAPDVCKDYKQTGFCGFGDSCKFLHAREDYKQGWQLDKEWETVASGKDKAPPKGNDGKDGVDDEEKMLENIPFKCIICKEDYKMPVVTKCGHYFCERCAMTRYMKEKKRACANCGADTGGSFGVARKLKELLEKKRRRQEERGVEEGTGKETEN